MKHLLKASIMLLCGTLAGAVQAQETLSVVPFDYADVTAEQKDAWQQYVSEQAAEFGCEYKDDPRLSEAPRDLLQSLAANEDIAPVKITLRSFMSAGPSVQELLARNMKIASVTCNDVYYYQGDLIGHPALPFEEYLRLITENFQSPEDIKTVAWIARNTKIAPLDPRIMWPLFVFHEEYYPRLDLSYPKLAYIIKALDPKATGITPVTAPSLLFKSALNLGNNIEHLKCDDPNLDQQPSGTLFIDPELTATDIALVSSNLEVDALVDGGYRGEIEFHPLKGNQVEGETRSWLNTDRDIPIRSKDCKE
jgi:hypothetical protein